MVLLTELISSVSDGGGREGDYKSNPDSSPGAMSPSGYGKKDDEPNYGGKDERDNAPQYGSGEVEHMLTETDLILIRSSLGQTRFFKLSFASVTILSLLHEA
jgi:hypothetical protein